MESCNHSYRHCLNHVNHVYNKETRHYVTSFYKPQRIKWVWIGQCSVSDLKFLAPFLTWTSLRLRSGDYNKSKGISELLNVHWHPAPKSAQSVYCSKSLCSVMSVKAQKSSKVLHRVLRFIELSLYLSFNFYTCGMEYIEPSPLRLGWHLAMDNTIIGLYFDDVQNIYSVPLVVWLGHLRKLIMQVKKQRRGHDCERSARAHVQACAFRLFP